MPARRAEIDRVMRKSPMTRSGRRAASRASSSSVKRLRLSKSNTGRPLAKLSMKRALPVGASVCTRPGKFFRKRADSAEAARVTSWPSAIRPSARRSGRPRCARVTSWAISRIFGGIRSLRRGASLGSAVRPMHLPMALGVGLPHKDRVAFAVCLHTRMYGRQVLASGWMRLGQGPQVSLGQATSPDNGTARANAPGYGPRNTLGNSSRRRLGHRPDPGRW